MLNQFGQRFYASGQRCIATNVQILNNNRSIWSHWTYIEITSNLFNWTKAKIDRLAAATTPIQILTALLHALVLDQCDQ